MLIKVNNFISGACKCTAKVFSGRKRGVCIPSPLSKTYGASQGFFHHLLSDVTAISTEITHCKFTGFRFTFRFLSFEWIVYGEFLLVNFFVKSHHSFLDFCRFTSFFQNDEFIAPEYVEMYLELYLFTVLARKFESVETSPAFARLLWENWACQKWCWKKSLNDESLEMNAAISHKKSPVFIS